MATMASTRINVAGSASHLSARDEEEGEERSEKFLTEMSNPSNGGGRRANRAEGIRWLSRAEGYLGLLV